MSQVAPFNKLSLPSYVQQRDNFSSVIFDEEAGGLVVYGFGDRPATSPQPPFAADDIIIVSSMPSLSSLLC